MDDNTETTALRVLAMASAYWRDEPHAQRVLAPRTCADSDAMLHEATRLLANAVAAFASATDQHVNDAYGLIRNKIIAEAADAE
jgi:hypothetical protein